LSTILERVWLAAGGVAEVIATMSTKVMSSIGIKACCFSFSNYLSDDYELIGNDTFCIYKEGAISV
jgi:hypothetical protein